MDGAAPRRPASLRPGVFSWLIGAAYVLAHLPFLAPSLEDIDSINFGLGLREYSPADHQPHPPGYPVYIALGRMALGLVRAAAPSLPASRAEALALSICSVVAGGVALVCAAFVFGVLARGAFPDPERVRRTARWATVFLAVAPLFWLTGSRPMSDMPGLAIALAAQALMLAGRLRTAAFVAGLAIGVRTQTVWLTAPLLLWLLASRAGWAWRSWAAAAASAAAGAVAWAIPLVVATGGPGAYLAALESQAGEDFAFVDMLWANPTPRRLAFGLVHTFVMPWTRQALAAAMLVLAAAGAALALASAIRAGRPAQVHEPEPRTRASNRVREPEPLVLLGAGVLAFAPYAVFHLLFQETITVRYALPLLPSIALLAALTLAAAGRATNFLAAPLAAAILLTAAPGLAAYAREPHPAFRAIDALLRRAEHERPGLITSHFELRRPLRAAQPRGLPVGWAPRQREWLVPGRYWREGGREPVWFLANPRRTDLALIDPHSRTDVVRFRWAAEGRAEVSGTRPTGVDWYRIPPPGWFLEEGWSLTAETGGVAASTGALPHNRPSLGYVRCRAEPAHLMVGGGPLDPSSTGTASLTLTIGGEAIDRWPVASADGPFLRFVDLPRGVPCADDGYAPLSLQSSGPLALAVRQFDLQPEQVLLAGFGPGWYDDEYAPESGLRWRWTDARATLRVRARGGVRLRVRAESPLKYFDTPPEVRLEAAGRVFARMQPASDFILDATVPAEAIQAARGELVLTTTHAFVPSARGGSRDVRRLGLRIFEVRVESTR